MINIVIPMAGLGSRFSKIGIDTPKPLIEVVGKKLIEHSVTSLGISGRYIFITRKYDNPEYNKQLSQVLLDLVPDSIEIKIDHITGGAAETCLCATPYIDNSSPLVITNCDQLLRWNASDFINALSNADVDGGIVLYKSDDPKNSFAEIVNGKVLRLHEKVVISDNALVGVHYWKRGKDFVTSAKNLTDNFIRSGLPETYISSTYNSLIAREMNILPFFIQNNQFVPLGTPEDVVKYTGKYNEFSLQKPKTLFVDLDGTVLKHMHKSSDVVFGQPELLSKVREKFDEWDSIGHKLILVTARKESMRNITENHLQQLGLCWDILIMGATSGSRVLINDKLHFDDPDRAIGINVITDASFNTIDWEAFGL